jgi:exodeoxyribonuclease-5
VFTLHGLAGTGKSCLLAKLAREVPRTQLATLTGKAASILARKTGLPAVTVHALIYHLVGEDVDARGRRELLFENKLGRHALSTRIVLLDECSMINEALASDLLRTGCRIIAAGDPGQLPPVKGSPFFVKPDVMLEEVHRQAWDSPIIRQAHAVRHGGRYSGDGFRVAGRVSGEDILGADMLLTWRRATRTQLNALARTWRGLEGAPKAGEPVACLMNDQALGLYNGAVYDLAEDYVPYSGTIVVHGDDGCRVWIEDTFFAGVDGMEDEVGRRRGGSPFMAGYAMTVHKAQGSEWDSVIVADEYRGDDYRRWAYTAITRARSRVLAQQDG